MHAELHVRRTEPEVYSALQTLFLRGERVDHGTKTRGRIIRLLSSLPTYPAVIAGADPLMSAMSNFSDEPVANETVSLSARKVPDKDADYMRERRGVAVSLSEVLTEMPQFAEAAQADPLLQGMSVQEMVDRRFDTIRVLASYNVSPDAFQDCLRDIGVDDPDGYMSDLITERDVRASAFVDAALGSWVLRHVEDTGLPRESIIMTREGWHAHGITKSLEGEDVTADIAINQTPVPSLERILQMPPLARDYMLNLFKNISRYNKVFVVHTHRSADNLRDIADYEEGESQRVPLKERAVVTVRNLMPPEYLDVTPQERRPEDAAPFMKEAVMDGKIILGIVGRLDPIKRDLTVLKRLNDFVSHVATVPNGQDILDKLRVAIVAKPKVLEGNFKVAEILGRYHDTFEALVEQVNSNFKEVTGTGDNFILVNRNDSDQLSAMAVGDLKDQVFPYVNACLQMGEEGLNVVVQEAEIQTTFGLTEPRPAVGVIARDTGFSEKVEENGLENFLIINDPHDSHEVTTALLKAYEIASNIKENPGSERIRRITDQLKYYYEEVCADSFFEEPLRVLATLRNSPVSDLAHQKLFGFGGAVQ